MLLSPQSLNWEFALLRAYDILVEDAPFESELRRHNYVTKIAEIFGIQFRQMLATFVRPIESRQFHAQNRRLDLVETRITARPFAQSSRVMPSVLA